MEKVENSYWKRKDLLRSSDPDISVGIIVLKHLFLCRNAYKIRICEKKAYHFPDVTKKGEENYKGWEFLYNCII